MISRSLVPALLILLAAATTACSGSGGDGSQTPSKSFLWEITSDSTTAYILGSVHCAPPDAYPLPGVIEASFAESDNLVVEADVTAISPGTALQLLREKGMYPPGESLQDHLPEDLYDRVTDELKGLGLPIAFFDRYEPWAVAMTLDTGYLQALGCEMTAGIDMHFLNKAHQINKPILELESAEFQIDLLDGLSAELQVLLLEYTIADAPTQEEMDQMFDAWESGDTQFIEKLVSPPEEAKQDLAPIMARIFDDRNIRMTEKIEGYLADDETYFVVVGAGHLVGENGIIQVLTRGGYQVRQL